jgi:hypothetical protein
MELASTKELTHYIELSLLQIVHGNSDEVLPALTSDPITVQRSMQKVAKGGL